MTYDDLLIESDRNSLITKEKYFTASKGRIKGNRIVVNRELTRQAFRGCTVDRKGEFCMAFAQIKTYTEDDYYNLPEDVRAELIDGQFYDMSAPSRIHQEILSELHITIGQYLRSKDGPCRVYPAPFAVKLFHDRKTIVEPDISVICDPDRLTDRGCAGAPDWIIEIVSPGNPGHDYVRKLNLYMDAGVREYWIVDPANRQIHVYYLDETNFSVNVYTFRDKINVNIYDDLCIDFAGMDIPSDPHNL